MKGNFVVNSWTVPKNVLSFASHVPLFAVGVH